MSAARYRAHPTFARFAPAPRSVATSNAASIRISDEETVAEVTSGASAGAISSLNGAAAMSAPRSVAPIQYVPVSVMVYVAVS